MAEASGNSYGDSVPLGAGFLLIFCGLAIFLQAGSFAVFALSWTVLGMGGGKRSR